MGSWGGGEGVRREGWGEGWGGQGGRIVGVGGRRKMGNIFGRNDGILLVLDDRSQKRAVLKVSRHFEPTFF